MAEKRRQEAKLKQDARKFLAAVPEEYIFWCHDGRVFRDMRELGDGLANISDETFVYHVNTEKNDFGKWVKDIIKDEKLATDLTGTQSRSEAVKIVTDRIAFLSSKVG